MKKTIYVLALLWFGTALTMADDFIATSSPNMNESVKEEVETRTSVSFTKGELKLSSYCRVVIYNMRGNVIYKNDCTNEIDCSDWMAGQYTAIVDGKFSYRFIL